MRLTSLITATLVACLAGPAFAQEEWDLYQNIEDGFSVNMPGQPKVEQTTWETQYRYKVPARIYRAVKGQERYTVTVADYNALEALGEARAKACPPGAETCRGNQVAGPIGAGYWKMDFRGALFYATFQFVKRPGVTVTDLNYQFQELVEGVFIQLTNRDESRSLAYVTAHEGKLYIFEGTVPKGGIEPALFISGIGFVDKDGNGIRYQSIYSNGFHGLREYPLPPRAGRGGGGGPAGAPGGGGAAPAGGGGAPGGRGGRGGGQ